MPLVACRSRRRDDPGRLRGLRSSRGGAGRATRFSSAPGATAFRRRPAGLRCWRCSRRCATAATSCSSTRAAPAARAAWAIGSTPTARAPPRAISTRCGASSAPATSSCTAPATVRASRWPTRPATPTGCARSCWMAGRALRSSPATAAPRRARSPRRSPRTSPPSRGWPSSCAPARCTRAAGSTTTCWRASSRARTRSTLGELPAAVIAALTGDAAPLARLVARAETPAGRQAAQARASNCHDDAPPAAAAQVDGGPFTGATWLRALGLAACKGWLPPAAPDPVLPAGATPAGAPALVLGGRARRRGADSDAAQGRRPAAPGTYVRVRGAGALPALSEPGGCAARSRARVPARRAGKISAGCASRACVPHGVSAFPARLATAPAALRDAGAHGRDRSTLADRRAATVAALGVADALAGAEAGGAPTPVTGLRGGSARVTRRGTRPHAHAARPALRARRGARRSRHARQQDGQRLRRGHAARGRRLVARRSC